MQMTLTSHVPQELEVNKRNVVFFQMVVHYLISWFVSIDDAQVIEMIHYICWAIHYLIYLFSHQYVIFVTIDTQQLLTS